MNQEKSKIRIDVVSDVACPWCYIGKRRIEQAIENTQISDNVQIIYHPFQLDPSIPNEGIDFNTYAENRFGDGYLQKFTRVENAGKSVGLDFEFEALPKAINTFHLHRFLTIAAMEGKQAELKELFLKAYFVDRIDLSKKEELINILSQIGWSEDKTLALLNSDEATDSVKEEMHYFRQHGVGGVPFYIFNKKYALSGAQPSEVFEQVFQQILQEEGITVQAESNSCDIETGEC
ncbi:DsbA family protein [Flectobacillus sp. BAB-3569]|uniref:DsbA family oxidoreductase n=1 Tax=Flectobacillus sp. BAB-3569 TaxID=1509483 RepID=UPI000BA39024|nr:DsbA family oxidoreductase [Flectobacillus sp. BAB-3569]PAC30541.1 disulfide bond formation protein DsbA [Flectobacillus sp. BAB-3569]